VSKTKFRVLFLVLVLAIFNNSSRAANPVNGQNDCGLIQGATFFSNAYPPPNGTPVTSGSCTWVRLNNTVCGTGNYGGTNYNLYPHRYVCSMPLDDYALIMLALVASVALVHLRFKGLNLQM